MSRQRYSWSDAASTTMDDLTVHRARCGACRGLLPSGCRCSYFAAQLRLWGTEGLPHQWHMLLKEGQA